MKLKLINSDIEIKIVDKLIIGRKSQLKPFLLDSDLSREHFQLTIKNNQVFITDLHSTNHTYINGNVIEAGKEFLLKNEDKIKSGNQFFIFSVQPSVKDKSSFKQERDITQIANIDSLKELEINNKKSKKRKN